MSNEMIDGFVQTIRELEAENVKLKLRIGVVMPRYILMGLEFNDIWKLPDFYVDEKDDILLTAENDISEAKSFDYDNAVAVKEYLQENYNDYIWYMVALNGA